MVTETTNLKSKAELNRSNRRWLPEVVLTGGLILMTIIACRMIYHDAFVDSSTYSNRSFADPAAGTSLMVVVYGCMRLKFLPLWVRLAGAPFVFFAGYLTIGLMLILVNAAI